VETTPKKNLPVGLVSCDQIQGGIVVWQLRQKIEIVFQGFLFSRLFIWKPPKNETLPGGVSYDQILGTHTSGVP